MISNRRRTLLLKGFVLLFGSWTVASFAFAVLSSKSRATEVLEASALPQLFLPHVVSLHEDFPEVACYYYYKP